MLKLYGFILGITIPGTYEHYEHSYIRRVVGDMLVAFLYISVDQK